MDWKKWVLPKTKLKLITIISIFLGSFLILTSSSVFRLAFNFKEYGYISWGSYLLGFLLMFPSYFIFSFFIIYLIFYVIHINREFNSQSKENFSNKDKILFFGAFFGAFHLFIFLTKYIVLLYFMDYLLFMIHPNFLDNWWTICLFGTFMWFIFGLLIGSFLISILQSLKDKQSIFKTFPSSLLKNGYFKK